MCFSRTDSIRKRDTVHRGIVDEGTALGYADSFNVKERICYARGRIVNVY